MDAPFSRIAPDVELGKDIRIVGWANLYGCAIGDETRIGPFVEIQAGAVIGARCKIQSHSFVPEGVTIEDDVFVGHGVMFTNDLWPRAVDETGAMIGADGWTLSRTLIRRRAVIGSGVTLLPVEIGTGALIGAGAVVVRDVPAYAIVTGNPGRVVGDVRENSRASRGSGAKA
jgi:UDP-2-acetamido-3-amino-2,3-dideoxy-glucuronate N-acetyltransferase